MDYGTGRGAHTKSTVKIRYEIRVTEWQSSSDMGSRLSLMHGAVAAYGLVPVALVIVAAAVFWVVLSVRLVAHIKHRRTVSDASSLSSSEMTMISSRMLRVSVWMTETPKRSPVSADPEKDHTDTDPWATNVHDPVRRKRCNAEDDEERNVIFVCTR